MTERDEGLLNELNGIHDDITAIWEKGQQYDKDYQEKIDKILNIALSQIKQLFSIVNTNKTIDNLDLLLKEFYIHATGSDDYGCKECLKIKEKIKQLFSEGKDGHPCPFIKGDVVCISDYMCPDCDEHKKRYVKRVGKDKEVEEAIALLKDVIIDKHYNYELSMDCVKTAIQTLIDAVKRKK